MLKELRIQNFVFVADMHVDFTKGLTVMTGETGAGKSVIAGAIHLVLGESLKGEVHLDKSKNVNIEATFDISNIITDPAFIALTQQYEVDISEHEIFFQKEIKPDTKSTVFINGRKSTNAIVKEFRPFLIDFHSQREQQSLFDEDTQLLYLDSYAHLNAKKAMFLTLYTQWGQSQKKYDKYKEDISKNEEKILLYQFQIQELETANLSPTEEAELDNEHHLLINAKQITDTFLSMRVELFDSEKSIYDSICLYKKELEPYQDNHVIIKNTLESLTQCISSLQDIDAFSRKVDSQIAVDEQRLAQIEDRLKTIYDLKNKYKKDVPQLLQFLQEMQTYVATYSPDPEIEATMLDGIASLRTETINLAKELHESRVSASKSFAQEIIQALQQLSIGEADFQIAIHPITDIQSDNISLNNLTPTGLDKVTYLFSANKGSALADLKATISGGELSRLLLVIKAILANQIPEHLILFDEIDSGIGGNTALKLAQYIKKLSQSHQIINISHLPQIAAIADTHLKIDKSTVNEQTIISLEKLDLSHRQYEIARMLSGTATDVALIHAGELLRCMADGGRQTVDS